MNEARVGESATDQGLTATQWASKALARHSRTAHEYVLDVLRRAILSGELTGGTRLVQSELAHQLQVSTTPVREALRQLTTEGLVEFDPHRGGIVHELDLEELNEILELRAILEPFALRRAAEHIDEAALARATALAAAMETTDDLGTWVDLNRRFHMVHQEASGQPRLVAMVTSLQDATAQYVGRVILDHPEIRKQAHLDHRGIISALAAHDRDRLQEIMVRHIQLPKRLLTPEYVQQM